jgi:ubiquinone/menaquinone biosynthesis C-methylase UbiE
MFPKTKSGEKSHRRKKREIEISFVCEALSSFFKDSTIFKTKNFSILEFGSGDGFQIPYLKKIGNLVASDTYKSNNIENMKDVSFVKCSITNTPFSEDQFDLIYSNHVIEHLEDQGGAFEELKRIGRTDCVYAFSVPTNIWLSFSILAQYYNKIRSISKRLLSFCSGKKANKLSGDSKSNISNINSNQQSRGIAERLFQIIKPSGHGINSNFISCYKSFRVKNWEQLFCENGFILIKSQPLLLYGPSEWPIIPTTKVFNRLNFSSSFLFVLKTQN